MGRLRVRAPHRRPFRASHQPNQRSKSRPQLPENQENTVILTAAARLFLRRRSSARWSCSGGVRLDPKKHHGFVVWVLPTLASRQKTDGQSIPAPPPPAWPPPMKTKTCSREKFPAL